MIACYTDNLLACYEIVGLIYAQNQDSYEMQKFQTQLKDIVDFVLSYYDLLGFRSTRTFNINYLELNRMKLSLSIYLHPLYQILNPTPSE